MAFTLTAGWSDASVSGTVRLVPTNGGAPILVPVVAGELRQGGQRGVQLDHSISYVMFFDGFQQGNMNVGINPVAIPAVSAGSTADVGAMTANAHTVVQKKH